MPFVIGVEEGDKTFKVGEAGYLVKDIDGSLAVYELRGRGKPEDDGRVFYENPRVITRDNVTLEIVDGLRKALEN